MRLTATHNPEAIKRYGHIKPAPRWKGQVCGTVCPGTTHTCTLARNHRGPHVAHGSFRKLLAVWDSGSRATASQESRQRKSAIRSRRIPRELKRPSDDTALWSRILRSYSVEEVAFLVLFFAFVVFAIDWFLRILG